MSWQARLDLARKGWHTQIRFSRSGIIPETDTTYACGAWARRHYWNGWIADICLHDHDIFDVAKADAFDRTNALIESLSEVCARAAREHPEEIVCQVPGRAANGGIRLGINEMEMRHVDKHRPPLHPTEDIPDALDICAARDTHIDRLLAAAREGLEVEDSINSYFGHARYASDCKNRKWGYRLRLTKRRAHDGTRITYRPMTFTSESLHETLAASMIEGCHHALNGMFARYAPGGDLAGTTENGLPPSAQTLDEYRLAQEAERALREAEYDDD